MPFSNYAELRAAVAGWLHRKDLVAQIPDFINLAERSINRIAQVRAMENEITLTLAAGARTVDLPANFTAPIDVRVADSASSESLSAVVPEGLPITDTAGCPRYWAVDGAKLAVERPADVPRSLVLRYRGGFSLSDDAPTNALLAKYPDLYLYGALLQAAPWVRDEAAIGTWQVFYGRAVKEVNATESRARAAAPLRTELASLLGCR